MDSVLLCLCFGLALSWVQQEHMLLSSMEGHTQPQTQVHLTRHQAAISAKRHVSFSAPPSRKNRHKAPLLSDSPGLCGVFWSSLSTTSPAQEPRSYPRTLSSSLTPSALSGWGVVCLFTGGGGAGPRGLRTSFCFFLDLKLNSQEYAYCLPSTGSSLV